MCVQLRSGAFYTAGARPCSRISPTDIMSLGRRAQRDNRIRREKRESEARIYLAFTLTLHPRRVGPVSPVLAVPSLRVSPPVLVVDYPRAAARGESLQAL